MNFWKGVLGLTAGIRTHNLHSRRRNWHLDEPALGSMLCCHWVPQTAWLILPTTPQPLFPSVKSELEDLQHHFGPRVWGHNHLGITWHLGSAPPQGLWGGAPGFHFQDIASYAELATIPRLWKLQDLMRWRIVLLLPSQWPTSHYSTTGQLYIATRVPKTNHPKTKRLRTISMIIAHKSTVS